MWGYFDDFISHLRQINEYREMRTPDILSTIFPDLHYIRVTRRDKVRQAVSLWKAIQTWTWRMDELSTSTGETSTRELIFNFEAINHLRQRIEFHERAWEQYFADCGVHPFTVVYEELALAYEETATEILQYLDIPIPENLLFAERSMKRQANAQSEEWIQLYHYHKKYIE